MPLRLCLLLVGSLLGLAACLDPVTPIERAVGEYRATTLTFTTGGQTVDALARGATINLALAADGSLSGHLFLPEGAADGGELSADLAGTWILVEGGRVTLRPEAGTFLYDRIFLIEEDGLLSIDGATRIVLTRL